MHVQKRRRKKNNNREKKWKKYEGKKRTTNREFPFQLISIFRNGKSLKLRILIAVAYVNYNGTSCLRLLVLKIHDVPVAFDAHGITAAVAVEERKRNEIRALRTEKRNKKWKTREKKQESKITKLKHTPASNFLFRERDKKDVKKVQQT